jgi:hypothetical protein
VTEDAPGTREEGTMMQVQRSLQVPGVDDEDTCRSGGARGGPQG